LHDHFRTQGLVARLVPAANIGACLQMALDGLGIACLPAALVDRQIAVASWWNWPMTGARHPCAWPPATTLTPAPA
jgi:hypothetical protein